MDVKEMGFVNYILDIFFCENIVDLGSKLRDNFEL